MCNSPVLLPNGVEIGCRCCSQCLTHRSTVWTGKCIAESKTATRTLVVTLTYGETNRFTETEQSMQAGLLQYEDVQLYLKRVRKNVGPGLRFFAAGEYGKEKGRAHWHLILFFYGNKMLPNVRFNDRYIHVGDGGQPLWPHGWSFWDECSISSIVYTTKYLTKAIAEQQRDFRFSIRPALGTEFFANWAAKHVAQGISPQNAFYSFPEARYQSGSYKGKLIQFHMSVSATVLFVEQFISMWKAKYGKADWPDSEFLEKIYDQIVLRRYGVPELDWTVQDLAARGLALKKERDVFEWLVNHDAEGREVPRSPLLLHGKSVGPSPTINEYSKKTA